MHKYSWKGRKIEENRGKQRSVEEERGISGGGNATKCGHESWNGGRSKWRVMVAKMIRETNVKVIYVSRAKFEEIWESF